MDETLPTWVVVCEASDDFEIATKLADRFILAEVDWANGALEDLRRWSGVDGSESYTPWKAIKSVASNLNIRVFEAPGPEERRVR